MSRNDDKEPVLIRSTFSLEPVGDGRTLTGIAVPFDTAQRVQDPGGPAYREAFAPGAFDVSIKQRAAFPLFVRHDYLENPIGAVTFQRDDANKHLMFDATVANTSAGDEMLELCRADVMTSVSVGFIPVPGKTFKRSFAGGDTQYRTEVILRELSLTPTGFGQYPQSQVLAIRDDLGGKPDEPLPFDEAEYLERIAKRAMLERRGRRLDIVLGLKREAGPTA